MYNEIRVCTELEWPNRTESLKAAIAENPANVLQHYSHPGIKLALASIDAPYIALVFQKKWRPSRALQIAFLGPVVRQVKEKIIDHANEWLQYANIRFNFVDGENGDIRITTEPGEGSWSYIGTDALLVDADKATMNYGWLTPDTPDEEYRRVVLHEFGHALGAIHEHQHPEAGIPWDRPKVYAYYARMGWSKEQVDSNIFAKYDSNQLNTSSYDQASIMHYAVPDELTTGDWKIDWNTNLSDLDKSFMRAQYP
jgi:hypothetical protein